MALYDFVIIGSGLGGLECAYTLSKEGYKVCVLEKNRQLGGNLQIFSRDKVIFDTGVHYLGGLDPGQNLHQFFQYYGLMDKLKLRRMDPDGFDRITFDNDQTGYPHAMGFDNFAERMTAFFPKEKEAIRIYCNTIQEICDAFPVYRLRKEPFEALKLDFLDIGAKNFIDGLTSNQKLRSVLAGSNPLYAGDAGKTPLYAHALTVNTYIESAWKCVDGGAQISNL
ncbi:MAG: NAD(P)/FAD-dependent oxidoreductase, partial [Saprospiraceae bacterium]|nr:NAD(P)/FAD-dependent oxidoreductase [Saprospiraceae bacterium]